MPPGMGAWQPGRLRYGGARKSAGPREETGAERGTDLLAAEAEDGAHAEAEIVLLGLAEIGEVETRLHTEADEFGDADIHGQGDQHGELGLVEAGIAGGG